MHLCPDSSASLMRASIQIDVKYVTHSFALKITQLHYNLSKLWLDKVKTEPRAGKLRNLQMEYLQNCILSQSGESTKGDQEVLERW